MRKKDFIEIHDYTADEVHEIFELARDMKAAPARFHDTLRGQTLAMIFEKSSTRTRVSFEVGMFQMGGQALFLSSRDIQIGRGEPISDTARVLSRYVDGIMARTFAHKTVTDLAEHASVPVINGLTDLSHPCQVMADYFTAWEKFGGDLKGRKIAWIGDGNNMAHSLMFGAPKVGMDIVIATPPDYAPDPTVIALAKADAEAAGTQMIITNSIDEAVRDADIVETDVWTSMGQEEESQKRQRDFAGWIVDAEMMAKAKKSAIFLHCLPAHRGEEVAAEVIDGPQSVIYDEAENRLHVQKAIMALLMKR
ncbi:MAG TPA: ornithine carbamoyltransferase [Thermoanaerobaculia bacterium]|jgi:ornithine carbamoyltransferase|nr:ornithine carbamoyltransferase [Thermoanaerobaculia bacterium]